MGERMTYKLAGVDVAAGYNAVSRMQKHIARTAIPGIVGGIGGFGGMFEIPSGYKNPVLVSGTDGVGTKLMLAFMSGIHNTVGIDCVAMCANDIVCQGAKPLFFLDYIGSGKLLPERVEEIVAGIAEGCIMAGCAIAGGETAELPGLYNDGEYDLAGFCVGIVEKDKILSKTNVGCGDVLIGLPSSGLHSNGFSLVRKLFFEKLGVELRHYYYELGKTLEEELLTPTRIYVKPLLKLLDCCEVHMVAHITGGGFIENIPRIIGEGLAARIDLKSIPTPPIFKLIEKLGNIEQREMFNTFNMGVGLVIAVPENSVDKAVKKLRDIGENPTIIGDVVEESDAEILFV
jgi:phosphoribosylformylglycinamidine cyclo-ligase